MKVSPKNVQMFSKSRMEALDKLTSGKRVDDATDDAGALNVSTHLAAKEASLKVAVRNIGEAITMATMADGGMQKVQENLIKLRQLATQAANGILEDSDRALIQKEFTALKNEIQSIAKTTEYNGIKVLNKPSDGSPSWTELVTHTLDSFSGVVDQAGSISVASVGGRTALQQSGTNDHLWFDMPALSESNVKISVDMYLPSGSSARGALSGFAQYGTSTSQLFFQEVQFGNIAYPLRRAGEYAQPLYGQDFGPIVEDGWVTMSIEVNRDTSEVKMSINGDEFATGTASNNFLGDKALIRSFSSGGTAANVAFSNLVIEEANNDGPFKVQAGENVSDSQQTAVTADVTLSALKMTSADVTTMSKAQGALAAIDNALSLLANDRAAVGSGMQRLMSQYDQVIQEHTTVSEAVHKIVDQDMAEASAEVSNQNMRYEISQKAQTLHKDLLRERIRKLFIPI